MVLKFRVGFQTTVELDLSEAQVVDLVDFVLNGTRGYDPCGSIFANNQALVALLQTGKRLDADSYEDYKCQLMMQK